MMVARKRKMAGGDDSQIAIKKLKNFNRNIEPDTLVRVEIYRRNEKPFDGRLSRQNLFDIWSEALRRSSSELDGFASVQLRGRALRINYRLKQPSVISEIFKKSEFEWENQNKLSSECDFYQGRVLGLSNTVAKKGDTVTVCVGKTALEFTDLQISRWLENFGKIEGKFTYQLDKLGFKTDDIEVELKLDKDIPESLPMYGRRIRIFYVGMKKQCNNCFGLGHLKSECEEEKKDWFSYIEELIESEEFDPELFGEWPDVIKRKRAEAGSNRGKNVKGNGRGGRGGRGRGRGK